MADSRHKLIAIEQSKIDSENYLAFESAKKMQENFIIKNDLSDTETEIFHLIKATGPYDSNVDYVEVQKDLQAEIDEYTLFKEQHRNKAIPFPSEIINGDQLRNVNSYDYLIHIAETIPDELKNSEYPTFVEVAKFCGPNSKYISEFPYGDLYTRFLLEFEKKSSTILVLMEINELNIEESKKMNNMFDLVYANPNMALERSAFMLREVIKKTKHTSETEKEVTKYLEGKNRTRHKAQNINEITPQSIDNGPAKWYSATMAFFAGTTGLMGTFEPLMTTSMASVRIYRYKDKADPIEYRFGTQVEYVEGTACIYSLFTVWIEIQPPKIANGIAHIYFNNLPTSRLSLLSGCIEVPLSHRLHAFEEHHNNLAVITLPAKNGILSKHKIGNHEKKVEVAKAKNLFLAIAMQDLDHDIKKEFHDFDELSQDFQISERIKAHLYGENVDAKTYDKNYESTIIKSLIEESFSEFKLHPEQMISEAQLQAVYFHFLKFKLTDYIIQKLGPRSINFTCKDAIDRGGISSAYYNLMKSIERGKPMFEDEFDRALHAGPILVKGRGMNENIKILWNAIDTYINANSDKKGIADKTKIPDWLKKWRDTNAPKESRCYWLQELENCIKSINDDTNEHHGLFGEVIDKATKLSAAKKLRKLARGIIVELTELEVKALHHHADLSKLREEFENMHIIADKVKKPSLGYTMHM